MIDKVANNHSNQEPLNLNSPEKIKEKLDYYRSLFGKTHDLPADEFESLKQDIATFFNLKPTGFTENPPERLVRISSNNRILEAQGKELSYLTDISQLLAPPINYCGFGRCNLPKQQVLYCAVSEAGAYWETKPKNGDVITISHYELKPGAKVNCNIIRKEKEQTPIISHNGHQVFYLLEDFFVDAFSLEVSRDRPGDYLFGATLASDQLFYPVVADNNIEAIIYPSVQKKKHGQNLAIRNDLIFERYNLIGVETRFILEENPNIDPSTEELMTDSIIGSFGTTVFDFERGKILYNEEEANKLFKLFRDLQIRGGKQHRNSQPGLPKNLSFNLSPKIPTTTKQAKQNYKIGRNDRINVVYQNGTRKDNVKYKTVKDDIEKGKCKITKY